MKTIVVKLLSIPVCVTVRKHVKHLTVNHLSNQATAEQLHGALAGFGYTRQQSLKTHTGIIQHSD